MPLRPAQGLVQVISGHGVGSTIQFATEDMSLSVARVIIIGIMMRCCDATIQAAGMSVQRHAHVLICMDNHARVHPAISIGNPKFRLRPCLLLMRLPIHVYMYLHSGLYVPIYNLFIEILSAIIS